MADKIPSILDSKPQEQLFAILAKEFAKNPHVDRIIQRGSFAKRQSDRASDIDLLLVVQDKAIKRMLAELDAVVGAHCTLMAPHGWVDTIVPDFGGIGFVYLVKFNQRLIQLDVYITPSSWSRRIDEDKEAAAVYTRSGYTPDYSQKSAPKEVIKQCIAGVELEYQIIFEFLLLVVMYLKHIYRNRPTLALKYRYALTESLAVFLRYVFTPHRVTSYGVEYKMYDWESDFRNITSPAVKAFERMLVTINIYSVEEIFALMHVFKTVLYESPLRARYKEFSPLIKEASLYSKGLLFPDYD